MKTKVMTRHVLTIVLAGALTGVASYASADPAGQEQERSVVKADDLNLSTQEGIRALYARIHQGAIRACARVNSTRTVDWHTAQTLCVHDSVARAISTIVDRKLVGALRVVEPGLTRLAQLDALE